MKVPVGPIMHLVSADAGMGKTKAAALFIKQQIANGEQFLFSSLDFRRFDSLPAYLWIEQYPITPPL